MIHRTVTMKNTWLMVGLVCLMLAACAAPGTPAPPGTPTAPPPGTSPTTFVPTGPPGATATVLLPTSPPAATPATLPDEVLAVYLKTGGFAGIYEKLTVYQGGKLELADRQGNLRTAQVDHAQLTPLRNMLSAQEFSQLEDRYQAGGADQFVYQVTAHDSSGKLRTVTTMDGAPTPPLLGQLIAILDQLRGQVR